MNTIKIPSIRGKIGDNPFYTTTLSINQIVDLIEPQTNVVENNSQSFVDLVVNQLIFVVYGDSTKWTDVRFEISDDSFSDVGILEFSGNEKIVPYKDTKNILKCVLNNRESLTNDKLNVVFVSSKIETQ